MDCARWHEMMSARLDGEETLEESGALDKHLDTCAPCRALLAELSAQHRWFRLHPAPTVPDLVQAALTHLGESFTDPVPEPTVLEDRRRKRQVLAIRAVGAAAAAAIALTSAALAGAFRGGTAHARPVVEVASARAAAAGESTLVYLRIDNSGASDVVTQASSPVADSVAFHRSTGHAGEAVMQPVTTVAAPARSTGLFASEKVHVMLEGLRRDLEPGDTVPVTLTFGHSGSVTVQATVTA